MKLQRRDFLKTTLAASASAAVASRATAASSASPSSSTEREYYELRCYGLRAVTRLKANAPLARLEGYLEKALLPALQKRGVKNVGVFTELDIKKENATSSRKPDSPLWVLIPHPSLDSFVNVSGDLLSDAALQKAGASYLQVKKDSPPFERIDSWLLRAFKGMPKLQLPAFSRSRQPNRIFEMRSYESYSELKALTKMAMFDEGEINLMKDIGMSPVFFGQALAGKDLPHLTYITSAVDLSAHLANWKKFGPHPTWMKMKDDPKYADSVSQNTPRFLAPTAYSEI